MGTDLIIIFILFAICLFVLPTVVYFRRQQQNLVFQTKLKRLELDNRAKKAAWAGATIVTARHHTSAEEMRESVRVDLLLEVQPPTGDSYTARTSWRVKLPLLSQFQPGQALSVKIDVDDPDLIFPNQPGAEFWS